MKTSLSTLALQLCAWQRWNSPLGGMLIARTPDGLAGIWFDGQKDHPGELSTAPTGNDPLLRRTIDELATFFAGRPVRFSQPLDLHGTPFQLAVWHQLQQIAAGTTCSYRDIARAVGSPGAVRAVGAAIGRNPVSVIVPCHRVIGSNGRLTGYAGGLDRKQALLKLEQAALLDEAA